MESSPRTPGPVFALALGLTALVTPLAVHLFFPVIPAVKVALGLSVSLQSISKWLAKLGLVLKKSRSTPPSRIDPTSKRDAMSGTRS